MEKKKNKLAFTLVELIIVITILTILGTISFISYIDISIDTKNTKVITDIENINKKINIKIVRKE
jgi:prepilin-type N-terminal cleavage/methylation domain-containing protein